MLTEHRPLPNWANLITSLYFLTPAYKPLISKTKSTAQTVRVWPKDAAPRGLYYEAGSILSKVTSGLTLGFQSFKGGSLLTGLYHRGN